MSKNLLQWAPLSVSGSKGLIKSITDWRGWEFVPYIDNEIDAGVMRGEWIKQIGRESRAERAESFGMH